MQSLTAFIAICDASVKQLQAYADHPQGCGSVLLGRQNDQTVRGFALDRKEEKPIRVMVADDHPMVLSGCQASLSSYGIDTFELIRSPEEVMAAFAQARPDVLVLDVKFGGAKLTGFDVARSVLDQDPNAKIVFWTQFDQDSMIREGYRLGALAYVTKVSDSADLAQAITSAHLGKVFYLPAIAQKLATLSVHGDQSPTQVLDARELAIFKLIAQGATHVEVAEKLDLAVRTISSISQSIKDKLGTHRAAELTLIAVRYGLIDP